MKFVKDKCEQQDNKHENLNQLPRDQNTTQDNPLDKILKDIKKGASTPLQLNNFYNCSAFILQIE